MAHNNDVARLRAKLPAAAHRLLDSEDGKHSEWATASAVAMHALNAGLTEDEYVTVVAASDFAYYFATENGDDRSRRLESRLRKVWGRAEDDWTPPLKQGELRPMLAGLLDRVAAHRWTGRSGASQRAVALAVVSKGYELNKWTVDASARDVALAAGVSRATAARALHRVAESGLWTVTSNGGDHAATVTLNLEWTGSPAGAVSTETVKVQTETHNALQGGEASVSHYAPSGCVPETPLRDKIAHPVFLRSALGPTAERLWFALAEAEGGKTAPELSELLGIHASTVRRTMDKLMDHSMATATGSRPVRYWYSPVDVEHLDRLAEEYDVLDWEQRTTDRIKREREDYGVLLEQRRRFAKDQETESPDWTGEKSDGPTVPEVSVWDTEPQTMHGFGAEEAPATASAGIPFMDPFEDAHRALLEHERVQHPVLSAPADRA
ncbi:hypothetical protein [Rhodococcus aetherivorans]|uniref:hypothetical protein n=1 Tax=Rhodococcus aetherivorans TaxID=191292 RepID=UPI00241D6A77|nr:hypothetical protein [Rhodococcus aetherivorans]WFS15171.1 hypothetical protein P9K37_09065 [Rhodococcus aetherivorans]